LKAIWVSFKFVNSDPQFFFPNYGWKADKPIMDQSTAFLDEIKKKFLLFWILPKWLGVKRVEGIREQDWMQPQHLNQGTTRWKPTGDLLCHLSDNECHAQKPPWKGCLFMKEIQVSACRVFYRTGNSVRCPNSVTQMGFNCLVEAGHSTPKPCQRNGSIKIHIMIFLADVMKIWRAIRIVVIREFHSKAGTEADAVTYFVRKFIDRTWRKWGRSTPLHVFQGKATGYKIGMISKFKNRENGWNRARRLSLIWKDSMITVLGGGALHWKSLKMVVKQWVERRRSK